MILNASTNILSTSNSSVKAIRITKGNASIQNFSSITVKGTIMYLVKAAIFSASTISNSGKKVIYIKPQLSSNTALGAVGKKYQTSKCSINCKANIECYSYDRDMLQALKAYLPEFIKNSKTFINILKSQGNELTRYNALIDDLANQFNIDTATWGLDIWETILNIDMVSGISTAKRRERIKFRLKINASTITKDKFKEIMDIYHICDIEEDFQNSKVNITVIGERGVPKDLYSMIKDADIFLPAHLIYEFIYTYLPWDELDQSGLVWNEIDNYTCDELETSFLI